MTSSILVDNFVNSLLNLHGAAAYLIVAALCFFEVALFVGFVLPGEIAVIYGGVLASRHSISLFLLMVVVVLSAVGGNLVGYEVGRRFGPWLMARWPLRDRRAVAKSHELLRQRRASAVFVGRFIAIARALVPAMAGMAELDYRGFFLASAAGGLLWGVGYCLAGFLAGLSYKTVIAVAGDTSAALFGTVVAVGLVLWWWRRRRRERATP